ncbi:MAG: DoxX family protein [Actinomycetota bacterium]|jgi:putative oxidoreductase
MPIGLLLLRLVVGAIFVGHGTQKLLGWFGGGGPEGTAGFVGTLGYRSARTMAILAGVAETLAGLSLVLGFLTPLGCVAIIGVMTNAILAVHAPKGFWNTAGGIEFPLVLIAVATTLAFTGPGRISIDRAIGFLLRGPITGVVVLLAGILAGVAVYVLGRYRREEMDQTRPLRPAA